jgi:hypothetical protein
MNTEKLQAAISSWASTPYKQNCSEKYHGASCLGFVFGVIKDVHNDDAPLPSLAFNGEADLTRLMRHASDRWGYREVGRVSKLSDLLPGDAIISVRDKRHHVLLVANLPVAWHTIPDGGVCPCSVLDHLPCRVYRCLTYCPSPP